jgi:hypothetical protein
MWIVIKRIITIGIPVVWLIIFVPKFIPSLNKVQVEKSHQPIMLYEYMEPEAMTNGDDVEEGFIEMESVPLEVKPGLLTKIWNPIKTVLSELKEILSTIALLFQVGKLYRDRRKRLNKK